MENPITYQVINICQDLSHLFVIIATFFVNIYSERRFESGLRGAGQKKEKTPIQCVYFLLKNAKMRYILVLFGSARLQTQQDLEKWAISQTTPGNNTEMMGRKLKINHMKCVQNVPE